MDQPSRRAIEDARGLAAALDVACKRAMHRWFGDNGAIMKGALAEALDTSVGTISRQMQVHDLPVQVRMLAALLVLLPDLAGEVLDQVGEVLGIRWHKVQAGPPTAEDLRSLISRALEAAARASAQALQDMADDVVKPEELAVTRPLLLESMRRQQQLLDAMEAAARREVG